MIIGITGTLGSGKGTVVEYLKERGFSHYSSSGILKEELIKRGLEPTRENLSELADELVKKYAGGILHLSYEKAQAEGVDNYILEAIHREKEAEFIKNLDGIVLGVDADIAIRYERISKRGEGRKDNVNFKQFVADSKREDDGQGKGTPNINAVLRNADFILTNNGTLEELHAQIEIFLEKLQTTS